jgi:hypothetical protein
VEERRQRDGSRGVSLQSLDVDERNELRERYRWEVVGPNPL